MTTLDESRISSPESGLRDYIAAARNRIAGGELGTLPVILGLAVIWTVFQSLNPNFLTAQNLVNLSLQITATGTIAVGLFLVLLLGEIDLSAGSVSGLCAAILAVLTVKYDTGPVPALGAALAVGALVGAFQGSVFTRFGVPSFVVTLAGLIGWQGLQLHVLGTTGTINLRPGLITDLTSTFLPRPVGWALAVSVAALYAAVQLLERHQRRRAELPLRPGLETALSVGVLASVLLAVVAVLNQDRGVPLALLVFVGFVVFFDVLTQRTRYGQHILAVGGNAEAARRSGIHVARIRTSVFILSSVMAAAGGVLAASRLLAVGQSSGGGDVLLNAIAAVVIGGTSLFGGRGRAYSALLGVLVIGSISNGMDLLSLGSSVKYMITGCVLLGAVTLDSLARRGRQAHGRA
ncbi:sugar ABC transporter permease [Archangium sp.]|uniref:sugar ABC transporter permease n=1 Tax=Archangium sp. TaxID=1872627 RepID=UPI002D5D5C25|nr:sugar ABC transporter permease [Archangium sp.]HYO56174.1 sugar ABC transporter permease [Archangium sp.]